jgi:nitric oxide reductase activation protein
MIRTRSQIESARRDGIDVIGVGFGGAEEHDMRRLFGNDSYVITSPDSLAEDVVGVYRDMI